MSINIDDIRRAFSKSAVTVNDGRVFLLYTDKNHVTQELYGELREILEELLDSSSKVTVDRSPGESIRISFCGDFKKNATIFLPLKRENDPVDISNIVIDTSGESLEDFLERKFCEMQKEMEQIKRDTGFSDEEINEELVKLRKFIYPNEIDTDIVSISLSSERLHTEFEGKAKDILRNAVRLCDGIVFEVDVKTGFLEILFIA